MIPAITFFIPGPPIGKARPRVTRRGTFTPTKTRDYERHVHSVGQTSIMTRADWKTACPNEEWHTLKMNVFFGKGRHPDLDNVIKSVMDGLEGVIWKNDSRVIPSIIQVGIDSPVPGILVEIEQVKARRVECCSTKKP